jgi:hypothetical protein
VSARLASVVVAAVLTTLAILVPSVSARFDGTTATTGNSFTAAPAFCTGSTTLNASADSDVDEASPTANNGTGTALWIVSNAGQRQRPYVTFALPAVPAGCTLAAATLRMSPFIAQGLVSVSVYRVTTPWTETGITWNTQPSTANPATYSDTSPTNIDALATVQAMYAGTAYGFMLRVTTEGTGANLSSYYQSREASSGKPQLVLTWG